MEKIYLLMCATGSYEDYRNEAVESYTSKVLADKVANGLNDVVDSFKEEIDKKKQDWFLRREVIWDNEELTSEESAKLDYAIDKEIAVYWKSIGMNLDYDIPYYSVQEIELINLN